MRSLKRYGAVFLSCVLSMTLVFPPCLAYGAESATEGALTEGASAGSTMGGEGALVGQSLDSDAGNKEGNLDDGLGETEDLKEGLRSASAPGQNVPAGGEEGEATSGEVSGEGSGEGSEEAVPDEPAVNDSTDKKSYAGITLARTTLRTSPSESAPEAEFFWGGINLSGFTRWDAAGEWLTITYRGTRYFVKSSDVSLNDKSGSFKATTLERVSAYKVPSAESGEAEFFWQNVSLTVSYWDSAAKWVTVKYAGKTYYIEASKLSSEPSTDRAVYKGITLARTTLRTSPSESAPEAEFFWGGINLSGFTRWDAAGEWLTITYRGTRYFVKSSDVSLNDGSGSYKGLTLRRVSAYTVPFASAVEAEFFWAGITLTVKKWDAEGEWVTVNYGGKTYFIEGKHLVEPNDAPYQMVYKAVTLDRTSLRTAPSLDAPEGDYFWGGVVVSGFSKWDSAGEWLSIEYAGKRYYVKASDVVLNDHENRNVRGAWVTDEKVNMYLRPNASASPYDFYWGGIRITAAPWDSAGEWLVSTYAGKTVFLPADKLTVETPDEMTKKVRQYSSVTAYIMAVDTSSHKVGIYKRINGQWSRIFYWDCGDGAAETPTVKGVFSVGAKGYYFNTGTSRCFYYTQFYGDYLFHSTIYFQDPTPLRPRDDRVGLGVSHGCVRLKLENAKWIYDNIPIGTRVIVY